MKQNKELEDLWEELEQVEQREKNEGIDLINLKESISIRIQNLVKSQSEVKKEYYYPK